VSYSTLADGVGVEVQLDWTSLIPITTTLIGALL
jgi:hypothetical protein